MCISTLPIHFLQACIQEAHNKDQAVVLDCMNCMNCHNAIPNGRVISSSVVVDHHHQVQGLCKHKFMFILYKHTY